MLAISNALVLENLTAEWLSWLGGNVQPNK